MLKIINSLSPWFEDCSRRIGVREYARLIGVSPPTASRMLNAYHKAGLLHREQRYGRLLFSVNNETDDAKDLCCIYWRKRLGPLTAALQKRFAQPTVILFGSAAKAEIAEKSDIDIALITPQKKPFDLKPYEATLRRRVNLHWFPSFQHIKNIHLRNNILNGSLLMGSRRWG